MTVHFDPSWDDAGIKKCCFVFAPRCLAQERSTRLLSWLALPSSVRPFPPRTSPHLIRYLVDHPHARVRSCPQIGGVRKTSRRTTSTPRPTPSPPPPPTITLPSPLHRPRQLPPPPPAGARVSCQMPWPGSGRRGRTSPKRGRSGTQLSTTCCHLKLFNQNQRSFVQIAKTSAANRVHVYKEERPVSHVQYSGKRGRRGCVNLPPGSLWLRLRGRVQRNLIFAF